MRIEFFEEFPTDENLSKAALVGFNSLVYIAAHSLAEFEDAAGRLYLRNGRMKAGYWPLLPESYWVSPFSHAYELETLRSELFSRKREEPLKVLIDLELPLLKPKLLAKNLASFRNNKRIISGIFAGAREHNVRVATAEFPLPGPIGAAFRALGISYSVEKHPHVKIPMLYSSMMRPAFVERGFRAAGRYAKDNPGHIKAGLGVIATGVLGNEPLMTPDELDRDLARCEKEGIETAVVFRLGGLDSEFIKVIEKHAKR